MMSKRAVPGYQSCASFTPSTMSSTGTCASTIIGPPGCACSGAATTSGRVPASGLSAWGVSAATAHELTSSQVIIDADLTVRTCVDPAPNAGYRDRPFRGEDMRPLGTIAWFALALSGCGAGQ